MPDSCCAIGCSNRRGDGSGALFYRIPAEPERRNKWLSAIKRAPVAGEGKVWVPSQYTRLCSAHFIKGVKSDDPLSPDWVPSIFSHTQTTMKREKDMERYQQTSKRRNRKLEEEKKDAVDVLLQFSSMPAAEHADPSTEPAPLVEPEDAEQQPQQQQCDNELCQEQLIRLEKECIELRKENYRLKEIIKSGSFEEYAFQDDDGKVKAMTGLPTYAKLQVVLTFVSPYLMAGSILSPFQQQLFHQARPRVGN